MAEAPRDNNQVTTLLAVSNADGITPVVLWADPTTHRLLVSAVSTADITIGTSTITGGTNGLLLYDNNGVVGELALATYPSLTELSYVKGATSAIQTQLNAKAPTTSPTFATSITGSFLTASELLGTDADKKIVSLAVATYPSLTEISYVKGVTSAIQTQITGKVSKSLFDANTIIAANADDTPAAVTIAEQQVVGRITSGNIKGLSIAELQTLLFSSALGADITLGENFGIKYDAALSADGKYSGIVRAGTAGATLAFGDLIYLAVADSRWELADASAASTAGDVMLGICVLAATGDAEPTTVLMMGFVRADTAFPALTIGAPAYISETAGDIVTAQPTTTDAVIRRVGFAWTADELYFNPSNDYITHT